MENVGVSAIEAGAVAATSAPAFGITIVNRPARAVRSTLKVVVFNARSGARFDGILACLRCPPLADADVILLCEADWRLRRSFNREIAADLAAELGMSFAYGPEFAFRRPSGAPPAFLGNAILSSTPLTDPRTIALPDTRRKGRYANLIGVPRALVATAAFGESKVTVAVAHLHSRWSPAGRARQMAALLDHLPPVGIPGSAILGGDFNTTTMRLDSPATMAMVPVRMALRPRRFRYPERREPLFESLSRAGFRIQGANVPGKATFTFSRAVPPALRPKLDWIALRGLEPMPGSARVVAARESFFKPRVSDHDFVMCEVCL
jgi:endonuclease/exonuclease/phosphatase family metal-dependent hydrolase